MSCGRLVYGDKGVPWAVQAEMIRNLGSPKGVAVKAGHNDIISWLHLVADVLNRV